MRMGTTRITVSLLVILALALAPAGAGETGRATLLLRCEAKDVSRVLQAVQALDVQVYDLETMNRLVLPPGASAAPGPVAAPELARPSPLADATALWRALEDVFAHYRGEDTVPWARIRKLDIRPQRLQASLLVSDLKVLEPIRTALLGQEAFLRRWDAGASVDHVQWGAAKQVEGGWKTDLLIQLPRRPEGGANLDAPPGTIDAAAVKFTAASHGLRLVYASRERSTRQPPFVTVEQKYEFETASPEAMLAFLGTIATKTNTTVVEAGWSPYPKRPEAPFRLRVTLARRGRAVK